MNETTHSAGSGSDGGLEAAEKQNLERLDRLSRKGVLFPCGTEGVFIGGEVDLGRIEERASIHPGSRITGKRSLIRSGASIGSTGPCVLNNMVLGKDVRLGSGSFDSSVLLNGAKLGSSIRVRENCLLEEGVELSFSVDVKHTFLLANVVLGSEINFCDVFMSGGTGRKDHSEVGSGVIHFNFTPFGRSGDKATASLIGDAVRGVFYNSPRIFIGGHTSLIGPLKIGYGSVVAAGSRQVADVGEGVLSFGSGGDHGEVQGFDFLRYKSIARKVKNCIEYIAQLAALWHWYCHARSCAARSPLEREIMGEAQKIIARGIETRTDRLDTLHNNMDESIARNEALGEDALVRQQRGFVQWWPGARETLLGFENARGDEAARDMLIKKLNDKNASFKDDFVGLVSHGLDDEARNKGIAWLGSIVDGLRGTP